MSTGSSPLAIRTVIPSVLGVGEPFLLKVRLLGAVYPAPPAGNWAVRKPQVRGPFNLNVQRRIQFMENCLPEWAGHLEVEADNALEGPRRLEFDGEQQGAYPNDDHRPIKVFGGFRFRRPGFHFISVIDPASGVSGWSNPVYVTSAPPAFRIYWGDPHWQTFFSDGIRCPEELYAFARDEAFLDFGAISDHMEGVTDRQWDYFQAVTNDYNTPGRFVTLIGQEWTHHLVEHGAPGHRNIYVPGDRAPALRCTDPDCNTLEKLWRRLENLEAIAIPHHSANRRMGVDWDQGWNPACEKAVEIHSVWGSSEKSREDGNTHAMHPDQLGGEVKGRHVIDALKRGFRLGFVGGGDIHDGRPGDDLHDASYPPKKFPSHPQGYTACRAPALTRRHIYDAIAGRRTYATTKSRILLMVDAERSNGSPRLHLRAATEEGIESVVIVVNGDEIEVDLPGSKSHTLERRVKLPDLRPDDFCYVRLSTPENHLAWSSPLWGDEVS